MTLDPTVTDPDKYVAIFVSAFVELKEQSATPSGGPPPLGPTPR